MKNEFFLLKEIGNIRSEFVEEAEKKVSNRKKISKAVVAAACCIVCLLVGVEYILANHFQFEFSKIFSLENKEIYSFSLETKQIPNEEFEGDIKEVRDKLIDFYGKQQLWLSTPLKGEYGYSFPTLDSALEFMGYKKVSKPNLQEDSVEMTITGNRDGEFETICMISEYSFQNFNFEICNWLLTDAIDSMEIGMQGGRFLNQRIVLENAINSETGENKYSVVLDAEKNQEYTDSYYRTKNSIDTKILQSTFDATGKGNIYSYFSLNGIIYVVGTEVTEDNAEEALKVLKQVLDEYE